jgi:UDP-N-acetylmuramyl pentapeptide phosphotransferase/UDP-N-acetylglucosamine-1-phosphate transferase
MIGLLSAFFASFIITLVIIRFQHLHGHFSGDHDLIGPQKFHLESVPRIGGISIALGILTAVLIGLQSSGALSMKVVLLLCAIPTFAIGLTEDMTKQIGVKTRLLFTAFSAALVVYFLDASVTKLDMCQSYSLYLPLPAYLMPITSSMVLMAYLAWLVSLHYLD